MNVSVIAFLLFDNNHGKIYNYNIIIDHHHDHDHVVVVSAVVY